MGKYAVLAIFALKNQAIYSLYTNLLPEILEVYRFGGYNTNTESITITDINGGIKMNTVKGMSGGLKILLVVVAVLVVLGIIVAGSYNGLVGGEEQVQNSFSNIDVQLQRRNDLIPNLVSTVKGYAAHEEAAIQAVSDARAAMMGAGTIDEKINADGELTGALSRLMAVTESYPDLKANANFLALQDELAGTENRIAVARKDYNDTIMSYNKKLRSFPTNMVAGVFGFQSYNAFTASPEAANAPTVDFGK